MAGLTLDHPLTFAFGILGNVISIMVYLAPIPTFCRICRKRSTEDFQSVPYVAALFSAMLWIYYALVKTDAVLLITVNSFGCFIETIYISLYILYAPKTAKVFTLRIFFLLNVGTFCSIVILTQLLANDLKRVSFLGWICVGFSICVFAAPLSIIRLVVRTKSVEYMPFTLSLFLTLSSIVWFAYGLLSKDLYILLPNVLGFTFGVIQMLLYVIVSRRSNSSVKPAEPDHVIVIVPLDPAPDLEVNVLGIASHELENSGDKKGRVAAAAGDSQ